ncbi:MAG: hypothetical protein COX43_03945 [Parcubacteria group bacterium CG23_combo_of_CG06-09_8_20_14_all_35_9]|nr:MAG: hypothetical protein COX43_03945 [Parcubacteria group bacterium CG23_combo_of_CG06-09_8_20_14_all_35_9]
MSNSTNPIIANQIYRRIALSFIGLTVVLVLVILYLSSARATLEVKLAKTNVNISFKAPVEEISLTPDPQKLEVIPGRVIEVTKEKSQKFPSTGSKTVTSSATGKITVINRYSKTQPLVATTRFLSPQGVLFRSKYRIDVPPGGKKEVEVYADKSGKEGKIGPTHFTIPGLWAGLQDKIYGESYAPMTGGEKTVKFVTGDDITKGREKLSQELFETALEEFGSRLREKETFLAESTTKEIVESKVNATANSEKDEFEVSLRVKVVGVALEEEKLLNLAEAKLKAGLAKDEELVDINPKSLTYSLENYDPKKGTIEIKASIEGQTLLKESSSIFNKDRLTGLTQREVQAYFAAFPEIEEVKVKLTPFWLKKIPNQKDYIKLIIKK